MREKRIFWEESFLLLWLFFYKDINKGKIGKKGEEIGVVNREYLQFGKEQGEKREDFSEKLLDWFRKN